VRERDMVARTGGDEFVVMLADLGTEQNAAHEAAERIRGRVRRAAPARLVRRAAARRRRGGVLPDDGSDADTQLGAADRAMYARKSP
jgi:GGDEF domain-containing protein